MTQHRRLEASQNVIDEAVDQWKIGYVKVKGHHSEHLLK